MLYVEQLPARGTWSYSVADLDLPPEEEPHAPEPSSPDAAHDAATASHGPSAVAAPASAALEQLQSALRSVELEVEARLRAEQAEQAAALSSELSAERTAHAATRQQLADAQAAQAVCERRIDAALTALHHQ